MQPAGESENKFALRPEATASIVRAYIEHSLDKKESYSKCYYIGSMFRGERPQKGRLRQFNHIGVEVIGNKNPYVDVEVISLASNLLTSFGVNDYKIRINNLGCAKDRLAWSKLLKKYLESKKDKLCGLCQQRFDRNVFRILDCKNKDCISLVKGLKVKEQHICKECTSFSDLVLKGLKQLNIAFEVDPLLVRGLDYYTKTVFEISHSALGSQDAIGAGGRYDNLVKELGGPDKAAVGFALGFERVMLACAEKKRTDSSLDIFVVLLGDAAFKSGFSLMDDLRKVGISCDLDYDNPSLKSQMRKANKQKSKFVAIIGDDEIKKKAVMLKNMSTGDQEEISLEKISVEIKARLC